MYPHQQRTMISQLPRSVLEHPHKNNLAALDHLHVLLEVQSQPVLFAHYSVCESPTPLVALDLVHHYQNCIDII